MNYVPAADSMITSGDNTPVLLERPVRVADQVWPEGTLPLVSVVCITYQHQKFIRQAIEGFLMQETTFPVEIFIHDDASTDGTTEIVREFAERYPKLFWTVLQTQNQWSKSGRAYFLEFLKNQRGEFTAVCEGDDFWTDSSKLMRQVSILQCRSDISLVFHGSTIIDQDGEFIGSAGNAENVERRFSTEETILGRTGFIPTSSLVYRASVYSTLHPWEADFQSGDRIIWAKAAAQGDIYYIPRIMSSYRIHPGGVSSNIALAADQQALIKSKYVWQIDICGIVGKFPELYGRKFSGAINVRLYQELIQAAWLARLCNETKSSFRYLIQAFQASPGQALTSIIYWKLLIFSIFPYLDFKRETHVRGIVGTKKMH